MFKNIILIMICLFTMACGDNVCDPDVTPNVPICRPVVSEYNGCEYTAGPKFFEYTCDVGADPKHPVPDMGYDNCYQGNGLLCCDGT